LGFYILQCRQHEGQTEQELQKNQCVAAMPVFAQHIVVAFFTSIKRFA